MDERLKKRIIAFYVGGIVNALIGLYVFFEGGKFLPPETVQWLSLVFLVFAVVDFYFPYAIKKKWLAENASAQRPPGDSIQRL
jgi:uncharacterized membrane protein